MDNRYDQATAGVSGSLAVHKFGHNLDLDTGVTEDIQNGPTALYVPPTVDRIHNLTGSADDAAAGTGVRTLRLWGVSGGALVTEDATMNGVTDVPTVNAYGSIHRMKPLTVGSAGTAVGDIDATAVTDATVSARISAGGRQTQAAVYLLPDTHSGSIVFARLAVGDSAGATAQVSGLLLVMTPDSDVFTPVENFLVNRGGNPVDGREFKVPVAVAAGSWVKMEATSDANNTEVYASFDMVLGEI